MNNEINKIIKIPGEPVIKKKVKGGGMVTIKKN